MAVVDQEVGWCRVCQTQHPTEQCPGYIELTGPERPSRRFAARRDGRIEHYQTLLAPAGKRWQARIVTVPNRMWSIPGGGGTAKFLDESAEEAERKAVLFIYTRCASLKVEINELSSPVDTPNDAHATVRHGDGKGREQALPALFGPERPMWPAKALKLSHDTLFLATARPEQVGTRIVVKMQLEHFHIPLAGVVSAVVVVATRTEPIGMHVALEAPPFAYRQYVDSLEPVPAE